MFSGDMDRNPAPCEGSDSFAVKMVRGRAGLTSTSNLAVSGEPSRARIRLPSCYLLSSRRIRSSSAKKASQTSWTLRRSTIPFAEMRDVQASLAEDEELRRQPFAAAIGIHVAVSLRSQRAWAMSSRRTSQAAVVHQRRDQAKCRLSVPFRPLSSSGPSRTVIFQGRPHRTTFLPAIRYRHGASVCVRIAHFSHASETADKESAR